jgi:hypothetical protein
MSVTIVTNNHPRDIIDAWELTPKEREQFDYLDWSSIDDCTDSASFFRYRGELYDIGEFVRVTADMAMPFPRWDGYTSDTYFSGKLIRYVDNFERVIVALFAYLD